MKTNRTAAFALCLLAGVMPATASTSGKKIAFSNNYAGNSWRQAMLKSFGLVAKKAVANKVVAAADVFTTPDRAVPNRDEQSGKVNASGLALNHSLRLSPLCRAALRV